MKYWIVIKNNLRKSKVTCVILLLLVGLATMLTSTAINAMGKLDSQVDKLVESTNEFDLFIMQPTAYDEYINGTIESMDGVDDFERCNALYYGGASIDDKEDDKDKQALPILIEEYNDSRSIGKIELVEESDNTYENGVYVPYYLNASEGYKLDDEIVIDNSFDKYTYVIEGFYQDTAFASLTNISNYLIYIKDTEFDKLYKDISPLFDYYSYRVKSDGSVSANDMEIDFTNILNDEYNISTKDGVVFNLDSMRMGVTMFPKILMGLLLGFALILIVIAVIVIRFAILSYIESNYKNLGVMEAAGYTSKDLIGILIVQFVSISVVGAIIGILLSMVTKGFTEMLLGITTGILWTISFDLGVALISSVTQIVIIAFMTFLLSLRIRKISVLNALRDGINTHNFKKNYIPLEKTILPLNVALGFKNLINGRKQNISIGIIVAILTFSIVYSFTMYYNFKDGGEGDVLYDFIGMNNCDMQAVSNDEKILDELCKEDVIDHVDKISSMNCTLSKEDNQTLVNLKVCDTYENQSDGTLLSGRFPEQDNEIAITTMVSKMMGVEINDTINIKVDDKDEEYLVVGITQQLNNLGKGASVTLNGVKRIVPDYKIVSLMIVLKDNKDIDGTIEDLYDKYDVDKIEMVNMKNIMSDVMTSYEFSMAMLCVVAYAITIVVVCMVLFLLVNIKVLRDRKNNGVSKALGFTTMQLVLQTVLSFLPTVICGCIGGTLLGIFGGNPLTALMLSSSGIKKCNFVVPVPSVILASIVIIVVAIVIAVLTALRVRKITPSAMLVEN